jgi:outer membrane immunogenic protein
MRRHLGLAFASVISLSLAGLGTASAADMAVKARPVAVAPILYSWTGCYIGVNGGGLWARKNWHVSDTGALITNQDVDGGMIGGQVGCNYQVNSWVFGIQGDYDWADANGRTNDQIFAATDGTQIRALGSVTGRVGYAWDQFLGYVKGGAAWERDNYDTRFIATNIVFSTASNTRDGYTVGIGGEYAFTQNLTGFVEYDYYDFGTRRTGFTVVTNNTLQFADIRETKNVLKAGLNWKFNWAQPVVARY